MAKGKKQSDILGTDQLVGDGDNPRKISEDAAAGLRASLKRFGDLSGIVFNKRTGELVTGHQRMDQIRAEYGDLPIELLDPESQLHGIRVDAEHYFPVRVVEWTQAKQRAANVAANNAKIQGQFTKELSTYLLSVQAELTEEMPGVLDDCLMVELLSAGIDTTEADADPDDEQESDGDDESAADESGDALLRFQVIVECDSEVHQVELLERFNGEGLKCRALIT